MKILLTGHRGFIASYMLKSLNCHSVTTYEWGSKEKPSAKNFDWVIHIGGISSTTEQDIEKILTQNLDFSVELYEDCKRHGTNMQYSSSASLYGMGTDFSETAKVDPKTGYAWSKYLFERYVKNNPGNNIVQGFRYFNVYAHNGVGEEHKGNQASPFCQFYQQAKNNGEIRIFENSDTYLRDFVPVEQVVDTHLQFLNVKESGIWNIGTGKATSFLDVAKTFNVPLVEIPMPELLKSSYQKYTCADMTKTNKTLDLLKLDK